MIKDIPLKLNPKIVGYWNIIFYLGLLLLQMPRLQQNHSSLRLRFDSFSKFGLRSDMFIHRFLNMGDPPVTMGFNMFQR